MADVRNEIIDNLQIRGSIGGGNLGSLARAVRVAMTEATSGSNGIQVADNANLDMATNDFTLHWEGSLPDYTPATIQPLIRKNNAASDDGFRFEIDSSPSGRVYITLRDGGIVDADYVSTIATGVADSASAKITAVIVRETASVAGSVTFYVNGIQLGAAVAIAAGAPFSISNALSMYISGTSAARTACDFGQAILYNRALSAAEVLSLYNNGPALADLGASQTAAFEGDFSAGAGGVTNRNNVTVAGNIDAIGGEDNWLRLTATGSSPNAQVSALTRAAPGLRARLTLRLFVPSGNPAATGVSFRDSAANPISGLSDFQPTTDVVTDFVAEFTTTTSSSNFLVYLRSAASVTGGVSGDIVYIKILRIQYLGITGWWDARDAQSDTGQILDSSGNKNHAMLPASGATLIGKPMSEARQVRWTNTWAGTQELQYIGGVNQAVLPATAFIESIAVRVSGADIHDIVIGDGVDPDRYVVISGGGSGHGGIALAAGSQTLPLETQSTDGTNLKLTVDPDTNCTMTMVFTITYRILE